MLANSSLVTLNKVVKHFDISGGFLEQLRFKGLRPRLQQTKVHAINDVSLTIEKGEIVSVVGESGCGKSTLARTVMGLYKPDSGAIYYENTRIDSLDNAQMLGFRRKMQMIFQDPYASLNPRMTVCQTLEEPLRFHNPSISQGEVKDRVAEVMGQVGVDPGWGERYPHEFSGGQRQRVSIARALVVDPEFIVADEPISALDVSIQAQILNLLMEARDRRGLTYMMITHDLSVVAHVSTRVAVMYLGTLCEVAAAANLFETARHPYTRALLSAIPKLGQKKPAHVKLKGEVPTPINLPSGCVFHGRCLYANERCRREIPQLLALPSGVQVACHGVEEGRILD
ncbi:ATP-binding cassette domain-containing protein [Desulfobotulus sp. H1]|uniref:ATP-binding cassette domain-containing protein n=1 Tax=Desulfobotulus pelophilus TaxID=2823377 RepID=A0ABT3NBH4_9BACT|nr:oligopeptide/dipeptide ABC transporter ATP-binding protein [Desulfobotulus pelophilus]MCW7754770.1 ATP-binding cassette domain-containing protein [Desulfobotulus pelophilus]